jgi:hypothetical protein
MKLFDDRAPELGLPWEDEDGQEHWSRFWSSYLGAPKQLRTLGADSAWERVVPLRWTAPADVAGPDDQHVTATASVLVHPSSISVIIRVDATGPWPLARLASSLAAIREGRNWALQTATATSKGRTLKGIAQALRDEVAGLLLTGGDLLEPASETEYSIAAPLTGDGDIAAFALDEESASSCLAGIAVLGRPGKLVPSHLLEENSDPEYGARIYELNRGHAIWHPANVLEPPSDDPLGCMLHNHMHLVAQIAALGAIVSWAAEQVEAHVQIPVAVHPLVTKAADRLEQLHVGKREKTYRAGIAKRRTEPYLPAINAIRSGL